MRRLWTGLPVTVASVLLQGGMALANPNQPGTDNTINPGVRIGEWIYTNVTALFAPLLAVVAIYYLARREFTKFLSFAVFAVFAALFIFAGTEVKDAAVGLGKWVIGK